MRHPKDRQERRAVREGYIVRRKFIALHIWSIWSWRDDFEWGRYSKYNLNCGCRMCRYQKYFKTKRKRRRRARQTS